MAKASQQDGKAPGAKVPRTERGRRTQRAILDAAAAEFGEKGFHDSSIVSITIRAGVALGSFYTYFDSKEALFKALVADMSGRVRDQVAPVLRGHAGGAVEAEGVALEAFLRFAREHKEIYRIIDEAEFVAPEAWRAHYLNTAARILERLQAAHAKGELGAEPGEVHAWAIMGMNVFLGLRFGVMDADADLGKVAATANALLKDGLG
ncbi:TetR family transcriptional regulator [Novosphingobium kunmingense]|uniref:TetR family transcriptional regulator n=1 Tax=Novosphingobium kunmingense TaxID=1211806 RepID=A0A2N0H6U9_9SPHN|nr:TetR/AcrR family transcriptional regulator [Novosphingobium kunmingense]PKB14642.1 TetR family transcriptional regulator [Novosphingobium kunmingense]